MSELILNYIKKDPISFAHITELLGRNYTIFFESEDGFIIKDNDFDLTYMSFSNETVMKNELSKVRYEHYLSYDKEVVDFYNDNDSVIKLFEYVYPSKDLFDIDGYDIRVLSSDYASFIDGFYKAIVPGETSERALKRQDVLGIFENNNIAGIVGRHPEGCMGMLHILKQYRGKGYATALEKAMINKTIKENKLVFCEVVENNEASMHLQKKLGLIKGNKKIYWLV